MIRAIRPAAVARDDASLISGWNIAPNVGYTVSLSVSASAVVVILASLDGATLVGSGVALVGTDQPVTITPVSGQTVGTVDADLGWHLLVTTDGTEGERTITIDPMVDLADEIHPIYTDDDMALARATAAINAGASYVDDVSVSCPLGLGAGIGGVVTAPVDGSAVVGQVESVTWSGTPDGTSETAVIRRHTAIAPEAYTPPPAPPVLVDDAAETDAATATSGNVLTNDTGTLTVVAVNGLSANVGEEVAGSNGGVFVIGSDGSWTFDPAGDFSALSGSDTATTSVAYHASNGASEASATLTITVSASGVETDPMWDDVALLIQAPETGTTIADAKGKTVTAQGNASVSTALGYPTIYFDGNGDRLDVGGVSDFKFLHNGSNWTAEFASNPSSIVTDDTILDTARGTTSNAGIFVAYSGGKIRVLITRGVSSSYVIDSILNYTFSSGVEKTVCLEYDHSLTTGTLKMYVDGVLAASADKTANAPSTADHQQMMVGMFHASYPAYAYYGHMRYMRITAGVRYGANHTSPPWPLLTE